MLALTVTQISYGSVPASNVDVAPPAGAKVVDLGSPASHARSGSKKSSSASGLAAVQARAGFPVKAPKTLVGLPLQDVRLVGPSDSNAALAVYGHGLGAIVVLERKADSAQGGNGPVRRGSERGRQVPHGVAAHRDHVEAHLPDAVVARHQHLGDGSTGPCLAHGAGSARAAIPAAARPHRAMRGAQIRGAGVRGRTARHHPGALAGHV